MIQRLGGWLCKWTLCISTALVCLNVFSFQIFVFLFPALVLPFEYLMNTLAMKPICRMLVKILMAAAFVGSLFIAPNYCSFFVLSGPAFLWGLQDKRKWKKRMKWAAIGGALATGTMLFLSMFSSNVFPTWYAFLFYFFAVGDVLFALSRPNPSSETISVLSSVIYTALMSAIGLLLPLASLSGSSGGLISFPWDWLLSPIIWVLVVLVNSGVLIFILVKSVLWKEREKLKRGQDSVLSLILACCVLLAAVELCVYNNLATIAFNVRIQQSQVETFSIKPYMEYKGTAYTPDRVSTLLLELKGSSLTDDILFEQENTRIIVREVQDPKNAYDMGNIYDWKEIVSAALVFSYYSKPQEIVFIDSWGAQARITRQDITDWMGRDFEKYADTPESFKAHVTDKLNVDHAEWDALRNRI